ncbi:uncharacterized protein TrAtP1_006375 [Trichoderma atroviride]|uniref:uncharacterized protein n=1 Tax=Hypocrea atroviridis TaxID=63577 RepID=UPI0033170F4E|nr:hypothetical protein TrAtP1_006375 [Trichoderma atroviride]
MAPLQNFANYPKPEEGPDTGYVQRVDHNPVLRGIPLMLGGELIARSNLIARYFYQNSGIDKIKEMHVLDNIESTFHPTVTPLGPTGPMLAFEPELLTSKYASSNARYYSISDYHELYKSGKTTPLKVVETLLALTTGSGKYSDAWADAHGAERLALDAAKASTERWAAGNPIGVLDGVPIGVKDDTDVEGYINHTGMKYDPSLACFAVKKESVWPVKKLQEAGAVVLGKNKMHELGSDTSGLNVSQGTPLNHLNNDYYPGGSSNGAGSSISAGIIPIAVATDAGGSVRIPAHFNGVYGLKPTHHRTHVMQMTMCVTGPMAANVADLTIAYRVMTQPNPDCPTQGLFALSIPPVPVGEARHGRLPRLVQQGRPARARAVRQGARLLRRQARLRDCRHQHPVSLGDASRPRWPLHCRDGGKGPPEDAQPGRPPLAHWGSQQDPPFRGCAAIGRRLSQDEQPAHAGDAPPGVSVPEVPGPVDHDTGNPLDRMATRGRRRRLRHE